jgi:hypothetical protein
MQPAPGGVAQQAGVLDPLWELARSAGRMLGARAPPPPPPQRSPLASTAT